MAVAVQQIDAVTIHPLPAAERVMAEHEIDAVELQSGIARDAFPALGPLRCGSLVAEDQVLAAVQDAEGFRRRGRRYGQSRRDARPRLPRRSRHSSARSFRHPLPPPAQTGADTQVEHLMIAEMRVADEEYGHRSIPHGSCEGLRRAVRGISYTRLGWRVAAACGDQQPDCRCCRQAARGPRTRFGRIRRCISEIPLNGAWINCGLPAMPSRSVGRASREARGPQRAGPGGAADRSRRHFGMRCGAGLRISRRSTPMSCFSASSIRWPAWCWRGSPSVRRCLPLCCSRWLQALRLIGPFAAVGLYRDEPAARAGAARPAGPTRSRWCTPRRSGAIVTLGPRADGQSFLLWLGAAMAIYDLTCGTRAAGLDHGVRPRRADDGARLGDDRHRRRRRVPVCGVGDVDQRQCRSRCCSTERSGSKRRS